MQRALVEAIPDHGALPVHEVAPRAGFVAENNRSAASAVVVFAGLSPPGLALVASMAPNLLGGEVGPGVATPWQPEDLWIDRGESARIRGGLPWAVIAGLRTRELVSPPHDARKLAGALVRLLKKPGATLDEVLRVLPGPEYGTGHRGEPTAIRRLYETGEGSLVLRTSFEIELPLSILVTVPEPEAPPTQASLLDAIEGAVRASRIEGVDGVRLERGAIHVTAERGQDLLALRRQLENILPREREVHYRLPMPLVAWLCAFLDEKRKMGGGDASLRRAILAARPPAPPSRRPSRG